MALFLHCLEEADDTHPITNSLSAGQISHPTRGFESQGLFTEASISPGRLTLAGSLGGQWTDTGSLPQEPGVAKSGSCSELPSTGSYFFFLSTEQTTLNKPEIPFRPQRFPPLWTRIYYIYTLGDIFVIFVIGSILGRETFFFLFPFIPPISL